MRNVILFAVIGALMACDPMQPPADPPALGPIPDTGISLSETVCFGTCPDYTVTVFPNEFYQLRLGQFTRAPGTTETGTFAEGTFAAANSALLAANFNTLPTDVTIGAPACGNQTVTDLPSARIGETTIAGTRVIDYYPGCFGAPDKPALDTLVASLRTAFGVPALVGP